MVVDLEWPSWNAIRSKAMQVDADPYIVGQFRGPANDAVPTRMTHRNAGPSRRKRCNSCGHDAHDAHDAHAGPLRATWNRAFGEHWLGVHLGHQPFRGEMELAGNERQNVTDEPADVPSQIDAGFRP